MPVQYSTAVLTIISDICACAVNTNMTVLRTQRPLSFYVHLVTLSLSHADVVVHYHMFDNNGNYKEYSASEVDWSKADKKMCTVEGMAARSLANACANITKRAWSDMGAPLRHLFNSGAGPEASELLAVQQGQVPWTHEQLHFDTKQKNMPQAQREVLMHWCCFDSALGDTAAGFVSQESLQNRQNKNHAAYAPFGTRFAAYMIENVLTKVEYGMADVLLPPEEYKGTMTPAELKIKVAELLQDTHASFTVEAEQRCLARFYDVDAWAALTDEEKASTHDYTVVNAKMMAGFDVLLLATVRGDTVPNTFKWAAKTLPPASHTAKINEYLAHREEWWTTHWAKFAAVLEVVWRTCLVDDSEEDNAEAEVGAASEGGDASDRMEEDEAALDTDDDAAPR